jgi:hypothetical protein
MHSRAKSMNEIMWHESTIWFFIAHKLLFANQSENFINVVIVLLHKALFYYNFEIFENFIILKKFENFEIL